MPGPGGVPFAFHVCAGHATKMFEPSGLAATDGKNALATPAAPPTVFGVVQLSPPSPDSVNLINAVGGVPSSLAQTTYSAPVCWLTSAEGKLLSRKLDPPSGLGMSLTAATGIGPPNVSPPSCETATSCSE